MKNENRERCFVVICFAFVLRYTYIRAPLCTFFYALSLSLRHFYYILFETIELAIVGEGMR